MSGKPHWATVAVLATAAILAACDRDLADRSKQPRGDGSSASPSSGIVYDIRPPYSLAPYSSPYPSLEVMYPGFEPIRPNGRCVYGLVAGTNEECGRLTFHISGGRGPTRRQMAENASKALPASLRVSAVDEFGFHMRWSKNNPAGVNFTREGDGGFLSFSCYISVAVDGRPGGVCDEIDFLSDGNTALLFFPYRLRNELPKIEAGIDRLMTSFHHRP